MTSTPSTTTPPGGTWSLGHTEVTRFGFGAMQLAGPGVFGPPADHDGALAVLRSVVDLGVTHIDTSDAYGPHVTNRLIREALHPYPDSLLIATKVGGERSPDGGWPAARRPDQLRRQVELNLESLGVERLDLVNLRMGDAGGTLEEPLGPALETLAGLQEEGLVDQIGLSNVTVGQVDEAERIARIVCVQNLYNVAFRADDDLIDRLTEQRIAYVPYFPLGGFTPVRSSALELAARRHRTTPRAVALAWLLDRSPNILLIPGTASVEHLCENIEGARLSLTEQDRADLAVDAGRVS